MLLNSNFNFDKASNLLLLSFSTDISSEIYAYKYNGVTFDYVSTYPFSPSGSSYIQGYSNDNGLYILLNSNFNIYLDDNETIFFQPPPQMVEEITIPALETAEQIPEVIMKTLKIMIPVGLIVLLIGFVVYLIKRVRYSIM